MRESQASLRIMAQQLWNTLNRERETAGARLPGGRVLFHPSSSVAEALTPQQCSGLSLAQHMALCDPPAPTYMEQLPQGGGMPASSAAKPWTAAGIQSLSGGVALEGGPG